MCLLTSRLSIPIKGARVLAVGARGRILRGLRPADRTERLQPVAEGTPFQADASVTAQLNIIHMDNAIIVQVPAARYSTNFHFTGYPN